MTEPSRIRYEARFFAGLVALFLASTFVFLLVWVVAPVVLGWRPVVLTSGSMVPTLQAGDVVVLESYDGRPLGPGTVVTFRDPAREGNVTHRIVAQQPDGSYITRGDGNPSRDSTPITADRIIGVGKLLVPLVGLPLLWAWQAAWLKLGLWGMAASMIIWWARWGLLAEYAPLRIEPRPARHRRSAGRHVRKSPRTIGLRFGALSSIVVLLLIVATAFVPSRAALSATDSAVGNSLQAASSFGCSAGDTGFQSPSAEAADTGGDDDGFEVSPGLAFADGGGFAENKNGSGDRHRFSNYGLSIPAGCSVGGIEVRLDWWLGGDNGDNSLGVELSWDGGASWTAAQTDTTETTVEHTFVLGGAADTWGRAWSISELTDANFRVRVTSYSDSGGRDFFLDWVPVKVTYTP